ncbi:MAG: hypothetical protein C0404_07980 [Verrucomicrobia bacterium]|nr:hypothetical protein [Verrucomicrobiota bacterium]
MDDNTQTGIENNAAASAKQEPADMEVVTTEERTAYANLLGILTTIAMIMMGITFAIYLLGILPPFIPLQDLPKYWSLPLKEYLKATHAPTHWHWLPLAGKGDVLNMVSISFLSLVTIFCYLRVLPIFLRKKNYVFLTISVLEILVLALAASGIISIGH